MERPKNVALMSSTAQVHINMPSENISKALESRMAPYTECASVVLMVSALEGSGFQFRMQTVFQFTPLVYTIQTSLLSYTKLTSAHLAPVKGQTSEIYRTASLHPSEIPKVCE